jgi:peptide/nickel transport system substrate-binding protein
MRVRRTARSRAAGHRRVVLASVARREWLLQMLALAAAGCARRGSRGNARASTVIMAVDTVNDIKPDQTDADFLIFSPLAEHDEHGELVPRLAQSWERSADWLEWTYHLRRDVRWHDGVPVTAHDVKFTLELLSHPDVHQYAFESVTVVDDYTVTVRVRRFGSTGYQDDIVYYPKHLLEALDKKQFWSWDFWTHPVGSGPFRFVRYQPGTMIEFEANPEYFRGRPKIERLVLKFVGTAGLTELLSGQVDVVLQGQTSQIPRVLADPRFRVYYAVSGMAWVIYWKHDHPLFRDPRVRRALTLAIDRTEILRVSNLPVDLPQSDGVFMPRVLFRGTLPPPLPYDPAEANRLLDASGWGERNGDAVRMRDGRAFRFTATVPSGNDLPALAVLVQAHLRRVGVQMEIEVLDGAVVRQRRITGQFEAVFGYDLPWAGVQSERFGRGVGSRSNATGYSNPEAFRLIDAAVAATSADDLDSIYRELTQVYRADLPVTRLVPFVSVFFVDRHLRGLQRFRARPDRYMEDLWLDDRGDG